MGRGTAVLFGLTCLCQSTVAQEQYEYDIDAITKAVHALTDDQLLQIAVHQGLNFGSLGSYWTNDLCRIEQQISHLIIPYVSSENTSERRSAIQALAYYGESIAPAILIPIARDKSDPMRLDAYRTLSRIKCEIVVDELLEMLDDNDRETVVFALRVLQEYKSDIALKAIEKVVDRNEFARVKVDETRFNYGHSEAAALTLISLVDIRDEVLKDWKSSTFNSRRKAANIVLTRLASYDLQDVGAEIKKLQAGEYVNFDFRIFKELSRAEIEEHLDPMLSTNKGLSVAKAILETNNDELIKLLIRSPEWESLVKRQHTMLLMYLAESNNKTATAEIVKAAKSDVHRLTKSAVRATLYIGNAVDDRSSEWILEVFRAAEKTNSNNSFRVFPDGLSQYMVGSFSSEVIDLTIKSKSADLRQWMTYAIWQTANPKTREIVHELLVDEDRAVVFSAARSATEVLKVLGIIVPPPASASSLARRVS